MTHYQVVKNMEMYEEPYNNENEERGWHRWRVDYNGHKSECTRFQYSFRMRVKTVVEQNISGTKTEGCD